MDLKATPGILTRIVVGLYAWLASVAFGAAWLDLVYARAVPASEAAFSRVADLLLMISAASVLAALAALVLAWSWRQVRSLLTASLALVILGLLAPVFLSPLLPSTGSPPCLRSSGFKKPALKRTEVSDNEGPEKHGVGGDWRPVEPVPARRIAREGRRAPRMVPPPVR